MNQIYKPFTMKNLFILLILAFFCVLDSVAQTNHDIRIGNAINKQEWFDLKRLYETDRDSVSPMLGMFSEAMIAHNFCSSDSACRAIDKLLREYVDEIGLPNALNMQMLLSIHLANSGKYSDALLVLKEMSAVSDAGNYGIYLDNMMRKYELLDSINGVNKNDAAGHDVSIPFTLDTIPGKGKPNYAIMMDARVNNRPVRILFDTGAGVNVVNRSTAKRLGINIFEIDTRVSGVGGETAGQFAIADKLELGDLKMENVPFDVFDISSGVDSIDEKYLNHLDMILGVKFMGLFDELHIDFANSRLFLPAKATVITDTESKNLCGGVHGLYMIEGEINGERVPVCFDTGAGSSILLVDYYERHKEMIENTCESDTLRQAGAGGIKIEKAYKLKNIAIGINGVSFEFPEIMVSTRPDGYAGTCANIGMDYFLEFSRIVYCFKEGRVWIEKHPSFIPIAPIGR